MDPSTLGSWHLSVKALAICVLLEKNAFSSLLFIFKLSGKCSLYILQI